MPTPHQPPLKVLIITVAFPPSPHANAKRPFFVAKAMAEVGWQVEVLTTRDGVSQCEKELLDHPGCRITRLPDPISEAKSALGPRLARILHLAANGTLWPDFHRLWVRQILRALRERHGKYDRILAFVFPPSLFLIGKEPNMVDAKWIFDLQEPVSTQFKRHPRRSFIQRLLTPRLERLERITLHQAGRMIFTADANRRACIAEGLVPAERTIHIPFFFLPQVFAGNGSVRPGFEIAYFGNFDYLGHRNPTVFFDALALFLAHHPEARPSCKFVFHGTWLHEHHALIDRHGLNDVVAIFPPLPFQEYLARVSEYPVLLLVAAAEQNLFMPSKVVDYIATGRPILAFAPVESEVAGILRQSGHTQTLCSESDPVAGAEALSLLWRLHEANLLQSTPQSAREPWSSNVQLPRYLEAVANP